MNLWTKQRSITHISYQMCYVVKSKDVEGKERGTSMPLQTGCLSVCLHVPWPTSRPVPPTPTHRSAEKPRRRRPSVGLFELNHRLTTTGSIGCIRLIKVVGVRGHLCSHNARWKSSATASPSPARQRIRLCSQQRSTKDQIRREWKQSKASLPNDL